MKKWKKIEVAGNLPTYTLTKEANIEWFAKVYRYDGRYIFTIGKRIKEGEPTPPSYTWKEKGWKSATTAKTKALEWINIKTFE